MPPTQDCALTHMGNVRTNNEDAFHADSQNGLWVVADGMGGHEAGEVASEIVVQTIRDNVQRGNTLSEAIQTAHRAVLEGARNGQGARGMGSTVVALKTDQNRYSISWVGDSRAYLWTRTSDNKGTLKQITTDHSYVQMLLEAGVITPEQADHHPDKNVITQCLGSLDLQTVRVDTVEGNWEPGQWILLCSDGLTDELEDSLIAAILSNNADLATATNALLQQALACGGRDNTTVIMVSRESQHGSLWDTMTGWFKRKS